MKCALCHLPFREGDAVYDMKCDDGEEMNHFHMPCFYETRQGRMGYNPYREYAYGEQLELCFN